MTQADSARGPVPRPAGPNAAAFTGGLLSGRVLPTAAFTSVATRHPRIAHVRMLREHVYMLTHPEVVRLVYVTHGRDTVKGRGVQQTRELLGDGLLTAEGELHRRQRRLVQPAFHREQVERYALAMVDAALDRESTWVDGARVDLAAQMAALTLDVAGRTLFGADLRGAADEVGAALGGLMGTFRQRMWRSPDGWATRLPTPANRRNAASLARLDAVVDRMICDQRAATAAGEVGEGVLSMLLAARDEDGTAMSDRQVRDEVMTLVLAGHETTANALTWAWFLLGRHTLARSRLHAEVDALAADPHATRLGQLTYTRAVVAEALRLYPPAWTIGRRLTRPVQVDGWTLPPGSLAVASQWVLHRDPRWWGDASSFRPERWLNADGVFDESAPGQPRGAWFPFGLGSRVCIGEGFAWTEATLVLATLARRWDPVILADAEPAVAPAVTLRPRDGMPARLRRRG